MCMFFRIKDEPLFGPLTQRLVSALIEENIMTPMDDDMDDGASNGKLRGSIWQILK